MSPVVSLSGTQHLQRGSLGPRLQHSLSRRACTSMRHVLQALWIHQHISSRLTTHETILPMTIQNKNLLTPVKNFFPIVPLGSTGSRLCPWSTWVCYHWWLHSTNCAGKLCVSLLESLFSLSQLKVQLFCFATTNLLQGQAALKEKPVGSCIPIPPPLYASSRDQDAAGQVGAGRPPSPCQPTHTVAPWSPHSVLHRKQKPFQ